jgi:ATP-dependent Clp protease ATP-binding subunit ClpX
LSSSGVGGWPGPGREERSTPSGCGCIALPIGFQYRELFGGLERGRILGRQSGGLGFGAASRERLEERDDLLRHVLPRDLEAFGMIPELLGRLPIIAALDDLGEEDLVRILGDPGNALLKQYRKLLRLGRGADLEFTPGAIREIARQAHARGVGAR